MKPAVLLLTAVQDGFPTDRLQERISRLSGPYGVGDTITYSIVVENTGNITLTGVSVSDPDTTVGTCTPAQPSTN